MKKRIICFVALFFNVGVAAAQVSLSQVDSLVNEVRLGVKETDNLILYKVKLDYDGGYYAGNYEGYFEHLFEMYYDTVGNLKKMNYIYYPDYYQTTFYFDTSGMAVCTTYFTQSMLGSYSAERYLDGQGELLYVYHVSRDDFQLPASVEQISIERIIRRAATGAVIPETNDVLYNTVRSIEGFQEFFLDFYGPERLRYGNEFPHVPEEKKVPVRFTMPEKGDVTSLTQNGVAVYKKPTQESLILFTLDIRHDIKIIDIKGDWYKISMTTYGGDTIEGYIHGEYLAKVERLAI